MLAVGLMSGTSMDGVDAVACDIRMKDGRPIIKILARGKTTYPARLKARLFSLCAPGGSADDVCELNISVARVFAKAALRVMKSAPLEGKKIDVIGSHGQTARHMPSSGATLQIGDAAVMAALTGVNVWSDFRSADMARGGQGAPLAPVIHLPLFGHDLADTAVVNIGGIANITHIPAGARDLSAVTAYDTGPGNILMDMAARAMGAGEFDRNGRLAAAGSVDEKLLRRMMSHPYFKKHPPKSTGREVFGESFIAWAGLAARRGWSRDVAATLAELTARTIVMETRKHPGQTGRPGRVVLCGGGAKNRYLAGRIKTLAAGFDVMTSDELGAPPETVEGALMALLAFYASKGVALDLSSITGAKKGKTILGKLSPA